MEVKINCAEVSEVIPNMAAEDATAEVRAAVDLGEVNNCSGPKMTNICREGRFSF
jgi:hypothetical protein